MKPNFTYRALSIALGFFLSLWALSSGAQDYCDKKYGEDSVKTLENLSVYAEFYKQKDYQSAYLPWKYVFDNAPCARNNPHIHGVTILKALIKAEEDTTRKKVLIDSLLMIYDVRAKVNPGREGNDYGRKAIDMMAFKLPSDEILSVFETACSFGNEVPYFIPSRYFTLALKEKYKNEEMTKEEVVDLYTKLFKIMNANIEGGGKYAAKFEAGLENMTANLSGTITKTCEDVLLYFKPKYEESPDDVNIQDLIYKLLLSKKCTDEPLFEEILVKRVESNPTSKSAYVLSKKMEQKKNFSDAEKYMKLALELEQSDSVKAEYLLSLASLLKAKGSLSAAREKALEAAKMKSGWGDPYIFIGDLYAASAKSCAGKFKGLGVYWIAVDMYVKARSIDASAAEKANKRIGRYSGSFPLNENIFFNQLSDGDPFTIACWINGTTTVRARK